MSTVFAFTDGAASNNQDSTKRQAGWGAVMMLVDSHGQRDARPEAYKELSGALAGATNNQAELEAVRHVLQSLRREGVTLVIATDSDYVIGVLSRHWKPKQNLALIQDIKTLMSKHSVTFKKVTGHSGNPYNERADFLAKSAF